MWQLSNRALRFASGGPHMQVMILKQIKNPEAIFDRFTMSTLKGTPLPIALRDCGITLMRSSASRWK
jgi:hypothetical protein